MTNLNLLESKILKSKYFQDGSILESKMLKNASWIWQSLMSAKELIEKECKKRIGNGKEDDIWKDRWINSNSNGKVHTQKPEGSRLQKVLDLIINHRWNRF